MTRKFKLSRILATTFLATLPLIGACDSETLITVSPNAVDPIFTRYVSLGNSVTAGYQSGGLTAAMQMESYAVLLAENMGLEVGVAGAEFHVPLMNDPGCPPPITNIFTQERVMGLTAGDCFLRQGTPEYLSNVAVPGSAVIDALTNLDPTSNANALTTLFLGGRTQIEAAAAARPTFVTVWMGNNDVLGGITSADAGDASHVTSPTTFAANFAEMMDDLDAIGTIEGGALIGVMQVTSAPYASPALAYVSAAAGIPTLTALPNCSDVAIIPGTTQAVPSYVPFHYGAVLMAQAGAGVPTTLDCSVSEVITPDEAVYMITSVTQYNAAIEAEAGERGWVYVDPNVLLATLSASDPMAVLPFPAFPGGIYPADMTLNAPFGTALSLDGVHPSASAHVVVANALIEAINTTYSTSIPAVN
jgi:lysophospholipase L1-like esterase